MDVQGPISEQYPSDDEEIEFNNSQNSLIRSQQSRVESSADRSRSNDANSEVESNRSNEVSDCDRSQDSASNEERSDNSRDSSPQPGTSRDGNNDRSGMDDTLHIMQRILVQKGIMDRPMNAEQLKQFLQEDKVTEKRKSNQNQNNTKRARSTNSPPARIGELASTSEVTLYKMRLK